MLQSLEIKNYRSCRSTRLEFTSGLTALIGKNGAGKSNLLGCIQWLAELLHSASPIRIESSEYDAADNGPISLRASLIIGESVFDYSFEAPTFENSSIRTTGQLLVRERLLERNDGSDFVELFRRDGEDITIISRDEPIRVSQFAPSIAALTSLLPKENALHRALSELSSFFAAVKYYSFHDLPDQQDEVPDRVYKRWARAFESQAELSTSLSFRLLYMWQEMPELWELFEDLSGPSGLDIVRRIRVVTSTSSAQYGKFPEDPSPFTDLSYRVEFDPGNGMGGCGHFFPMSLLSEGTRRALRILASLLFDKRSLMLIEQPEDSIHPGLLSGIIELCREYSDRSQIILTTHSPRLLDVLNPEEVLIVTAEKGCTTTRRLSDDEILNARDFLNNEGALSDYINSTNEFP